MIRALHPRPLHAHGILQNGGPKPARARRELARLAENVKRVLWRRPGSLGLWVARDWRQARAHGRWYLSARKLPGQFSGLVINLGPRALLILNGRAPSLLHNAPRTA